MNARNKLLFLAILHHTWFLILIFIAYSRRRMLSTLHLNFSSSKSSLYSHNCRFCENVYTCDRYIRPTSLQILCKWWVGFVKNKFHVHLVQLATRICYWIPKMIPRFNVPNFQSQVSTPGWPCDSWYIPP